MVWISHVSGCSASSEKAKSHADQARDEPGREVNWSLNGFIAGILVKRWSRQPG
jgi:hypothetical protein